MTDRARYVCPVCEASGAHPVAWPVPYCHICKDRTLMVLETPVVKKEYAWECNECGSQSYTMAISEVDIQALGCGKCGSDEWHKAEVK